MLPLPRPVTRLYPLSARYCRPSLSVRHRCTRLPMRTVWGFLLPMIFAYNVFVYWTFRGKVRPGEGYH